MVNVQAPAGIRERVGERGPLQRKARQGAVSRGLGRRVARRRSEQARERRLRQNRGQARRHARLAERLCETHGPHTVEAEPKEIRVEPDVRDAEHALDYARGRARLGRLGWCIRLRRGVRGEARVRIHERAVVQLAAHARERQGAQGQHDARHHVRGHVRTCIRTDRCHILVRLPLGRADARGRRDERHHVRLRPLRVGEQAHGDLRCAACLKHRRNLAQLHARAAHLDLVVAHAPEILNVAPRCHARAITGRVRTL